MTVRDLREKLAGTPASARVVFAVELAPFVEHGWEVGEVRVAGETVELRAGEQEG